MTPERLHYLRLHFLNSMYDKRLEEPFVEIDRCWAELDADTALLNEALQRLLIEGYGVGFDPLVQSIRERLEAK